MDTYLVSNPRYLNQALSYKKNRVIPKMKSKVNLKLVNTLLIRRFSKKPYAVSKATCLGMQIKIKRQRKLEKKFSQYLHLELSQKALNLLSFFTLKTADDIIQKTRFSIHKLNSVFKF